jgi:RNA polymerase sigma-70 factor, ECF subfamily
MRAREVPDLFDQSTRTPGDGPLRRGRAYTKRAMAGMRGDERAWIRGAQAGSLSDLEALFREHWPRAYRAAYLVVHDAAAAEDIAQEAFLAAIRALDRFDRRRPFGPWLHRIVVNRAIDWARSRALRAEVGDGPLAAVSEADQSDEAFSPPIVAALAELSPEQRAVIVLRHLLEYTPGEIAELLELPRGTVNSRLRRGLDELADLLEGRP